MSKPTVVAEWRPNRIEACLGVGLCAATLLAAAPAARAAVTCNFTGPTGPVTVSIGASGDNAAISHESDDTIRVNGNTCGATPATATTTTAIQVSETGSFSSRVEILGFQGTGTFSPGSPVEIDGASEIEFQLSHGVNGSDDLVVWGRNTADVWALGTDGINLTAAQDADGDGPDIVYSGAGGEAVIEYKELNPEGGDDEVNGSGGFGAGTEAASQLRVFGTGGEDKLTGGSALDSLIGGPADDTLSGRAGNDSYDGGAGDDTLDGLSGAGGTDSETASYNSVPAGVTVDLALIPGSQDTGGAGTDTFSGSFNNLIGSPFADTLSGNNVANFLGGGGGNDTLDGRGNPTGNDILSGDDGADLLRGGFGDDQVHGNTGFGGPADPGDTVAFDAPGATTGVSIPGLPPDATSIAVSGEQGDDLLRQLTGAIGTPFADSITGNALANTLSGGGGDDSLFGLGGPDAVHGQGGADIVQGQGENDTVTGGDGNDPLLNGGDGADAVFGDAGADNANGAAGADNVAGGADGDVLGGGADNDVVAGEGGADNVAGEGGDDVVDGADGDDAAAGGAGNDAVNGAAGADTVAGDDGDDSLDGGGEDDNLLGGAGDDSLSGGSGNDLLFGDAGKDSLLGLGGIDKLFAKDKTRDAKIHCGPGKNKKERARFDRTGKRKQRDPKPKSC